MIGQQHQSQRLPLLIIKYTCNVTIKYFILRGCCLNIEAMRTMLISDLPRVLSDMV